MDDKTLTIKVKAEIGKFQATMSKVSQNLENVASKGAEASAKLKQNISKAGATIQKGFGAVAKGSAVVGGAMATVVAATSEYREGQAKLASAFEAAGSDAQTASTTYQSLNRVLGDSGQATEAANHLAKLTTNQKDLEQWTRACEGVYATFGESLPIEGLTEAANETAKVGQVTGPLADALNWAGIKEDEFNAKLAKCNTEAEREKLIRETLSTTYEKAAASYEKNAAQILAQNEAHDQLMQSLSTLAEAFSPFLTAIMTLGAHLASVLAPIITSLAESVLPIVQSALESIVGALESAFNWMQQHTTLLTVLAGIIGVVVAAIGLYNAVILVKNAIDLIQCGVLKSLIAAKLASAAATMAALAPYIAIVAVIGLLVAAIVLCIKNWDKIKAKVTEVWKSIKDKCKAGVDAVKQKFTDMKNAIKEKVDAIKTAVREKFESIKNSMKEKIEGAKTAVRDKFEAIKTSIRDKVEGAKTAVSEKFSSMKEAISSRAEAIKSAVGDKFGALKDLITKPVTWAKDKVKGLIDKIRGFFKFTWSLPHLKLPHLSISGKFSIKPPSVPKFGVKWYAHGGVFDSPTLFNYGNGMLGGLGEAGAEAVVPLEKNTKWLDRIATMLNDKQGGGRPIILQVDGKTFAQMTVDSINDLTRQRGSLPLRIV